METKLDFVCPGCSAVNRVPEQRLGDSPVCAKCKASIIPDHPIELTDQTFEKFISRSSLPVVVDFWASWCGPCRSMAPQFENAAGRMASRVVLAKLNTESNQAGNRFNITGIPCLIMFKSGKETARQAGAMSADQIVQWIESVI